MMIKITKYWTPEKTNVWFCQGYYPSDIKDLRECFAEECRVPPYLVDFSLNADGSYMLTSTSSKQKRAKESVKS